MDHPYSRAYAVRGDENLRGDHGRRLRTVAASPTTQALPSRVIHTERRPESVPVSSSIQALPFQTSAVPRAAERDHRRPPVVEAAFRRVDAKRPRHVLVRDLVHAPGGADRIESGRPRHVFLDGGARRARIETHLAAEKEFGVEVAEHHVRVGQGGAGSALCVAGGPGVRPRALRPDPNETALVDPGERAASSPWCSARTRACSRRPRPPRSAARRRGLQPGSGHRGQRGSSRPG